MHSPLWIINSVFAAFAALTASYVLLVPTRVPKRTPLTPTITAAPVQGDVSKVNISRIYESDLFGTYVKPAAEQQQIPAQQKQQVAAIPQPPRLQQATPPTSEQPSFLPPLAISIKGIMYSSTRNNRAIIEDTKTKRESLYRVGDSIEDAEIIFIGRNKVVFLRSNGQEESVYISEAAAQQDTLYPQQLAWDTIITMDAPGEYTIQVKEFTDRIRSLAQVLDELGIVTAFRDGRALGCKIGNLGTASWGRLLGLQPGDVVTAINDNGLTTTSERVQAYQEIRTMKETTTFTISLIRNSSPVYLRYTCVMPHISTETAPADLLPEEEASAVRSPHDLERQKEILQASTQSSSMRAGLKKQDTKAMLERGGRRSVLRRQAS